MDKSIHRKLKSTNILTFIRSKYFPLILLLFIILIGGYFRFVGINWDENFHLHPDERFLTMVESSLSPVKSLSEYFDTVNSTLNPHNAGYSFFVYGTFPIFLVRYVAGWLGKADYNHVFLIGRALSAGIDLLTILLIYFCAERLYKNKWLSLIAAAFASGTVLFIQQSHFFVVDSFTNFFTLSAIYFAICIQKSSPSYPFVRKKGDKKGIHLLVWNDLRYYLFFGLSLGLAAASKINTIVVAVLLPLAVFLNDPKDLIEDSDHKRILVLRNLALAAFTSFIVFRIFQPYAFSGPGFINLSLNPKWIDNLKELNFLSSGDSNYPPSLQWARRSYWFGFENMIIWGLGLPLGVTGVISILWMGKKILNGAWKDHLLLWLWTVVYFIWQSFRWNPTMRYFLPIYPTLIIIAAWGLVELWKFGKRIRIGKISFNIQFLSCILITIVITATFLWAFAFTGIYTRPVTRVSASEWIYQNIPSSIDVVGSNKNGNFSLPVTPAHSYQLNENKQIKVKFVPETDGTLVSVKIDHIVDSTSNPERKKINVEIFEDESESKLLYTQGLLESFQIEDDPRGNSFEIQLENPIVVHSGIAYYLRVANEAQPFSLNLAGDISISIFDGNKSHQQAIYSVSALIGTSSVTIPFTPPVSSLIDHINLFRAIDWSGNTNTKILMLTIVDSKIPEKILTQSVFLNQFTAKKDFRGTSYSISLDNPLFIDADHTYFLKMQLIGGNSEIGVSGSQLANETSWDDAIPLGMFGYNPFDYQTGLYQSDLNLEIYWDENQQKFDRFVNVLSKADIVYMSSNRQWGSITQIPERYPLSNVYYRALLGCPDDKDIQWCYRVAEPGMFNGKLGFQLIRVFQSDPAVFGLRFNTQFAEEAFSVYDHPKVLIFQKDDSFSNNNVEKILSKVDLTKVINLTPKQANSTPGTLTMSTAMKNTQYEGGTWQSLFNFDAIIKSNSIVGLIVWYLLISLLGWVNYPLLRLCFSGLNDKGYPVHRLLGLLLLAFLVWFAGSLGIDVSKTQISLVFLFLLGLNLFLYMRFKNEIKNEIAVQKGYLIRTEIITLAFFVFFLLIRLGNPDLWHPYKGGEKPMDFSYLNAVMKSTVFPPYDPWFANGYMNYYYFGFVLAGVPVKWLGFEPSVAYNFILPTFFSLTAMGAFSFMWNIHFHVSAKKEKGKELLSTLRTKKLAPLFSNPYFWGILGAVFILIIGNLGTVRMLFQGFQRLASGGIPIETGNFFQRQIWAIQGFGRVLFGQKLNYYPGDWYWIPSRAIPGESITEFPFFTFLYGDPHAHLFSLPITLTALIWGLSILFTNKDRLSSPCKIVLPLLAGSIIISALRVTNTWDYPVFLLISLIILLFKGIERISESKNNKRIALDFHNIQKLINPALIIFIFLIASYLLYYPFSEWYGQAYNSVEIWNGSHTPFASYLTHWGFFFFITIGWWIWDLHNWMAETSIIKIQGWAKYRFVFLLISIVILFISLWMIFRGVEITWIVIPLLILGTFLLINKPNPPFLKLINLTALAGWSLTLMVEVIVLKGDIGRMNTVFKFYLQAWTLISLSSACFLFFLLREIFETWNKKWRRIWLVIFAALIIGVCLYPLTATIDKITDRMNNEVLITLNGMDFMKTSTYSANGISMDLGQDYQGIKWMQANVKGSPVIVEANVPEYQWGNRYTIYTGLPGVVGWNWHQRQQRAILPSNWVTGRIDEISNFYSNSDPQQVISFLQKYQIKYVIVGQLEKITYPGIGLEKFEEFDHVLWEKVFEYKDTKIYTVII